MSVLGNVKKLQRKDLSKGTSCDKGLGTSHCLVSINYLNDFYYGLLPFLLNEQSWSWSLLLKCSQLKDSFEKVRLSLNLAHCFWFCFVLFVIIKCFTILSPQRSSGAFLETPDN